MPRTKLTPLADAYRSVGGLLDALESLHDLRLHGLLSRLRIAAAAADASDFAPPRSESVPTLAAFEQGCDDAADALRFIGALPHAIDLAVEVEALATQYLGALQVGEPALLSAEEMAAVLESFSEYRLLS